MGVRGFRKHCLGGLPAPGSKDAVSTGGGTEAPKGSRRSGWLGRGSRHVAGGGGEGCVPCSPDPGQRAWQAHLNTRSGPHPPSGAQPGFLGGQT